MSNTEYTAEDFNLYTRKPGVQRAVDGLNMAFLNAETLVVEGRMKKGEAFSNYISPAMDRWSEYGACDSDARDCIIDLWNKAMKGK
jgi:hypothetical protein